MRNNRTWKFGARRKLLDLNTADKHLHCFAAFLPPSCTQHEQFTPVLFLLFFAPADVCLKLVEDVKSRPFTGARDSGGRLQSPSLTLGIDTVVTPPRRPVSPARGLLLPHLLFCPPRTSFHGPHSRALWEFPRWQPWVQKDSVTLVRCHPSAVPAHSRRALDLPFVTPRRQIRHPDKGGSSTHHQIARARLQWVHCIRSLSRWNCESTTRVRRWLMSLASRSRQSSCFVQNPFVDGPR
ncbi:hypothetical protein B0H13DRAFT_2417596 [Mycena leptocephala]|nr:hypothetical protein B0H13DRAFT_2417596 [Mycena leptocephala]